MRLTATISCYEQRDPAPTVGIDASCRRSNYSWLAHYTPLADGRPTHRAIARRELKIARPSGRQDSNLRPLVPQTSPYFPMRAEFDLECFRRELVGMTTRARVMESAGIASTSTEVYWAYPISPLPHYSRTTNSAAS